MSNSAKLIQEGSVRSQLKGERLGGSEFPELTVAPTVNKFNLNPAAALLMGVKDGDTVCIHTVKDGKADTINDKFAISKIPNGTGAKLASTQKEDNGALVSLSFNMAGPYALMLKGDPSLDISSIATLEKEGLIVNKTATSKVYFKFEEVLDENDEPMYFALDDSGELVITDETDADGFKLFALIDRVALPYTAKVVTKKRSDDIPVAPTEEVVAPTIIEDED